MKSAVKMLLIIGILINLLKGADLLLRPKQQAWIQGQFETFTLRLDYTKPLDWYKRFNKRMVKFILIVVSALLLGIAIGFLIVEWNDVTASRLPMLALVISVITWDLLDRKGREHRLIKFLLNPQRFTWFLLRPFLIIAMAVAIDLAFFILDVAIYWSMVSNQTILYIVLLYFLIFTLGILWTAESLIVEIEILAVLSLLILCVSVILLIAEAILIFLRGIAWRIVEYNKGAYAAIILLITIILGVFQLLNPN